MLKAVFFCSRSKAESEPSRTDWAVISISKWGVEVLQFIPGWHAILRLEFHDIEQEMPGEPWVLFSEDQAKQVIGYVRSRASEVTGIMVHCRAGVSRSAAMAKWIADEFELPFDHDYSLYNRHVYTLLHRISKGAIDE